MQVFSIFCFIASTHLPIPKKMFYKKSLNTCKRKPLPFIRCHTGWQGSNCTECVKNSSCLHGYCREPFECICNGNWSGTYCNISSNATNGVIATNGTNGK